ncbi:MAG: metal ABC transporter permease [Planctomycetota bacterium]
MVPLATTTNVGGWMHQPSEALRTLLALDLFPLLAGVLACVSCGVLGNFLVLRRLSLMGDAISHSVLPGLVVAFLLAGTSSPLAMLAGATIAGIATVVLVEAVKKLGRIEPGAAMGVVFSVLFALGVLLIERAAARNLHLDADCVLHGQLEYLAWYSAPDTLAALVSWSTLGEIPRQVVVLAITAAVAIAFVVVLFKELRIAAFDAALATSQGFHATALHYALMVLVAAATVASFEAVGSILVIAMLVCPAATARLLTNRLATQIAWSVAIAIASAVGGYVGSSAIPAAFGLDAVNAAGGMTVAAGGLLVTAIVAAPRHGVVSRLVQRRRVALRVALDDALAALYRNAEAGRDAIAERELASALPARRIAGALRVATRAGMVERRGDALRLTPEGTTRASALVRRHRLWESYLVDQAGYAPDHVHDPAEQLEHLDMPPPAGPSVDPHGRRIPGPRGPS